ncbi:MAG: glycosyltransferase family 2 protein [Bacillota bacterium]|jgi:cellulose synthase/poly-beta-1,6-N-acetylglucosamine synthase-like glycosyltransferase
MTTAQTLYVVAFSVYLLFFVLFARFFVWKNYSEKKYWNQRPRLTQQDLDMTAKKLGKEAPFISILVPARNESLVIENTLRHLSSLKYPENSFEIIVVTDEKEILAANRERQDILDRAQELVRDPYGKHLLGNGIAQKIREGIISSLSDYALTEFMSKKFEADYSLGIPELSLLPAKERHVIVRDISIEIFNCRGTPNVKRLRTIVKRTCPWLSELDIDRLYPASLAVSMPVLAAYTQIFDDTGYSVLKKAINHTAKANHELTQDIILRMTEVIAGRVAAVLKSSVNTQEFRKRLLSAMEEMYPTTQEVVAYVKKDLKKLGNASPEVKHIVVPFDFDGKLGGNRTGENVPSTKGRALNWGLGFLNPRSEICGFYDAESRPHQEVLLYVGYRRLLEPGASRVLQGPVFQVRNFYSMSPFCRIAALYQAIAHDWYLPWLFRTLPFVGGTNVFVERNLIREIGGWDCHVLTEDLELGVRAYLKCSAWPEYLPYSSSEQTPPNFRAFFKQRLRWGTGHLQVVDKISSDPIGDPSKRRRLKRNLIIKGQLEWVAYQIATFVPPVAMVLHYKRLLDPHVIPAAGQWMLSLFSIVYMGFTIYAFRRYRGHLDTSHEPDAFTGRLAVYLGLLLLPLAAFMFPVPYTTALLLKTVGKEPKAWVKTPRTGEGRLAV